MNLVRVEAPAPILDVDEVKKSLRIDFSDDDDEIASLIDDAVGHIDGATWFGRALGPQTWDYTVDACDLLSTYPYQIDHFGTRKGLELPLRPLIDVVSITALDSSNVAQPFTDFVVSGANAQKAPGVITPTTSWPTLVSTPNAMTIRFRCGYAETDNASPPALTEAVPAPIKRALKLMVRRLYDAATVDAAYEAVEALLNDYRVFA